MLPSATEMIHALGLGDQLVAVSHECDYPVEAKTKPKAVANRFPTDKMDSAAIDAQVTEAMRRKESIYTIDLDVLRSAKPDLIVTQALCDVCAITGTDLSIALRKLNISPQVVEQTPKGLSGIFEDIRNLGKVLGAAEQARALVADLQARLKRLKKLTRDLPHPRVFAMEWLDPPYASGHWVPELVEAAGGREMLGTPGKDSKRTTWEAIAKADPEIIVLMPCGFDEARALKEAKQLEKNPVWKKLNAVRNSRVYAVDANAYFSRPGPRTIEGAELLARLFFPEQHI